MFTHKSETHVARNFSYFNESEGRLKVKGSHVTRTRGKVQDWVIVTTDHYSVFVFIFYFSFLCRAVISSTFERTLIYRIISYRIVVEVAYGLSNDWNFYDDREWLKGGV